MTRTTQRRRVSLELHQISRTDPQLHELVEMTRPTQRRREDRVHCTVTGCTTTFGRIHELVRHLLEVHAEKKTCPVHGCRWRGTKREHRLRDHVAKKHPNYLSVELDIPEDFSPNSSPPGPSTQADTLPYHDNSNANTAISYNNPSPWHPHTPSGAATAPTSSPYSTGSNENSMNPSNYTPQQPLGWSTTYNNPAPAQASYNAAQTYVPGSSPMSADHEFEEDFQEEYRWEGPYDYDNTSNGE